MLMNILVLETHAFMWVTLMILITHSQWTLTEKKKKKFISQGLQVLCMENKYKCKKKKKRLNMILLCLSEEKKAEV